MRAAAIVSAIASTPAIPILKAFMIVLLRNRGCIIIIIFALGKLKIAAAVFPQRALL
jgi:hypothetical protein